ncbi:putative zinc finger protein [Rosellinia necatrix]|uniref:Biogenesis of lysosome-related organelles complex 1 subunit CNL1 n=1 Tax=Rosellinia necatrix TaxID=77044 RepID=A0A1W2TX13_ROSNE|nr:putative zinc finger protein [Rosellinia necatrix]
MPSTEANTVEDTQLGLTEEEIALLRYHQAQAAGSSSSRAASRASSQGRLLLDSSSLASLSHHLDRLMQQIQVRIEYLSEQSSIVTMQQYDRAGNLVDNADAEIARFQDIMSQIDELEVDFDRIAHIRDIVRDYRLRVEQLERELEQSNSSSRRDRDGHRHHHSHRHHGHTHRHESGSSGRRHRH